MSRRLIVAAAGHPPPTCVRCAGTGAGGAPRAPVRARPAAIGGRPAPERPGVVRRDAPAVRAGRLVTGGTEYTHAQTTFPSDSFPGMVAQFTGGGAGTTGVYYDDTYNHRLLAPGTLDCATAPPRHRGELDGGGRPLAEPDHPRRRPAARRSGAGGPADQHRSADARRRARTHRGDPGDDADAAVAARPGRAARGPGDVHAPLPAPVPAREHRLRGRSRTRPAHRVVGQAPCLRDPQRPVADTGIQDLFTPEINSVADTRVTTGRPTTRSPRSTTASRSPQCSTRSTAWTTAARTVGTPAIFGMNFQTVSTAEKLPSSDGLAGGYNADGTPGPLLSGALDYVDSQVAA